MVLHELHLSFLPTSVHETLACILLKSFCVWQYVRCVWAGELSAHLWEAEEVASDFRKESLEFLNARLLLLGAIRMHHDECLLQVRKAAEQKEADILLQHKVKTSQVGRADDCCNLPPVQSCSHFLKTEGLGFKAQSKRTTRRLSESLGLIQTTTYCGDHPPFIAEGESESLAYVFESCASSVQLREARERAMRRSISSLEESKAQQIACARADTSDKSTRALHCTSLSLWSYSRDCAWAVNA